MHNRSKFARAGLIFQRRRVRFEAEASAEFPSESATREASSVVVVTSSAADDDNDDDDGGNVNVDSR